MSSCPVLSCIAPDLGYKDDRILHVTARFGYMDQPNIPGLLPLIWQADIEAPR